MTLAVEDLPKRRSEFIWQAGFRKKRSAPVAFGARAYGLMNVGAYSDNWNIARARVLLEILEKLPAVAVRLRQIGHDNVRVRLPRSPNRFGPILSRHYVESHRRERERIQFARVVVAFNDQHERSDGWVSGTTAIHGSVPVKSQRARK